MADAPIKGPGAAAAFPKLAGIKPGMAEAPKAKPPKAKTASVVAERAALAERFAATNHAPALAIEQSVQEAALELKLTHKRLMEWLIEIAEAPFQMPGPRVAAIKELAEIIGTKKQAASNHLHLHQHLESVPAEVLQARITALIGNA